MRCIYCGSEEQDNSLYCTKCGAALTQETPVTYAPAPESNKIGDMLKDSLFIVICILMTVATAINIISGSFLIIQILITIFLWLAYSQATKGLSGEAQLRCVSGAVYANYIITNVLAIILIVCGAIISAALGLLSDNPDFMTGFTEGFESVYPGYAQTVLNILGIFGWLIGLLVVLIAVAILVINVLGMKKIHKFVKSLYQSISIPYAQITGAHAAKNWLIFFGVCSGISALSSVGTNIFAAVAEGCIAAATIIAAIIINKYFVSDTEK